MVFLMDSVINFSFSSFAGFLTTLVMIFVYYYFDQHYKNFSWYKSGKLGFSGLAVLTLIFITRALLAIFTDGVLSFVSKYEVIASGLGTVIALLLIFRLGKTKE